MSIPPGITVVSGHVDATLMTDLAQRKVTCSLSLPEWYGFISIISLYSAFVVKRGRKGLLPCHIHEQLFFSRCAAVSVSTVDE